MYISHKSNIIQQVHGTEWKCRRMPKGQPKAEYWEWLATITSGDPPVVDYSGETGYTIVECRDEDVNARLVQLSDYVSSTIEGTTYNIKYYATKRDSEIDGVKSHFIGDDTAKNKRILDEEWKLIRKEIYTDILENGWNKKLSAFTQSYVSDSLDASLLLM